MTAYDPALCERTAAEAKAILSRYVWAPLPDPSTRTILEVAADQLEAAQREVERLTDLKRGPEWQEDVSAVVATLRREVDHWREARRIAMEAGEILKAEQDALRAEVARLTTAAQLSRSGAAEAVRDHDRLVNENEQLRAEAEQTRPVLAAADVWRDATDVTKGRPTGAEILRSAIALSDAIDVYRVGAVGELPSATRELANEIRRLQDALDLAARHTPFSPEPCPLCIHAGATCAMHRHIDSLGESVVRQLGRIAELETGPREACAIAGNTTKE